MPSPSTRGGVEGEVVAPFGTSPACSTGDVGLVEVALRIATWNVTWWTQARLTPISSLECHFVALQETKLSALPLENVRSGLRRVGYTLHHGAAVSCGRGAGAGARGGVGLLASPGVALSPLPPLEPAYRRLHAMGRLHGVLLPPRDSLPLGLRAYTVYAPLPRDPSREAFNAVFRDFVATLDMQTPCLLLGDFNGTVDPARDHSSGSGPVCPLLSRLLGPGGPFIDLQVAVSPDDWAHTFSVPRHSTLVQSRCDLVLGNRAALPLVSRVWVASEILEGGHSPVLVELRLRSAWSLHWTCPRPRLPDVLRLPGSDLRKSPEWKTALEQWEASGPFQALLPTSTADTVQRLSTQLQDALQDLVALAGGWTTRNPIRRPAYESLEVRSARATLRLLGRCHALLRHEQGVGSYSTPLLEMIRLLRRRGLRPSEGSRASLLSWVEAGIVEHRERLSCALRDMRADRQRRCEHIVPRL